MSFRSVHLLRLGLPAALVAAGLVTLSGSGSVAAEPGPYRPPFDAGQRGKAEFEPNSIVVKFKEKASTSARKATASRLGAKREAGVEADVVELTGTAPATELLRKAKADPAVELASLNYIRRSTAVPNDEYYGEDQAASNGTIRMPQAWDLSRTAGTQTIAVLDTGVDAGHPDLTGRLLPGYNTFNTAVAPNDDNGHGTMVSGIIAAKANNSIGVAGTTWAGTVRPVKVLDREGSGSDANVINGINWAVKQKDVRVINMSLGASAANPVLHDVIKQAVAAGVVIVAAAGNDGSPVDQYPAMYPEVIAVGATNATGVLTEFSNFGDWVDLAAPGWDILSTGPRALTPAGYDPYWYCTGTSCSTPIVAGVAAMVRNKWPAFSPAQVAQRLKVLARDAGPRGIDPYYGWGILDAYQALGGRFAPDFPGGAEDGNDQPTRATKVTTVPATVQQTITTEGDVDWYAVESAAARQLKVSVTGQEFNSVKYSVNVGPLVRVFDQDLKPIGQAANVFPPIDPVTEQPKWGPLTATVEASAPAGTTYVAVSNTNGSRDARAYSLSITEAGAGAAAGGTAYPLRDLSPAELSATAARDAAPVVTFAREVVPESVTASTVRLVSGKSGAAVAAAVTYDPATKKAKLTPSAPLTDATPYKVVVSGVQEAGGAALQPFSAVFSTKNVAPEKLTSFTGSGGYLAANLAWKLPVMTDLDQVIVRHNPISQPPTPTTGTLVSAGTSSSVKVTGLLQGRTYTFGAWVKDRAGNVSPISTKQLLGTKVALKPSATLATYGSSITLTGSLLRIDGKATAGLPVALYARPKNVSAFKLLTTLTTSATGAVSYTHKPAVSTVYALAFLGNADWMGARTANLTVEVKPTVTSVLTPTSIRLGQTTKFAGMVTPANTGSPVWLQQYRNRAWHNLATVKLSTTGYYAFGIRPTTRGQIAYRVNFPADADQATALSPQRILTIR